jgi:FkbM family methyltransferase
MIAWRHQLRMLARRVGVDVSRYRPLATRRAALIDELGIQLVIDAGANVGQYGGELRMHGYRGPIVSFEPLAAALAQLRVAAASDPLWSVIPLALGEASATVEMNVTSNLASSSLLPLLTAHRTIAPDVTIVAQESVDVRTLDEIELPSSSATLLKLDVQGFEDRVLRGATTTLESVQLIECELSIVAFYGRQLRLRAMLDLFAEAGFELTDLEPGPRGRIGETAFVDALLVRSDRS